MTELAYLLRKPGTELVYHSIFIIYETELECTLQKNFF